MTALILAMHEKFSTDRLDYDVDYGKWMTNEDILDDALVTIEDGVTFFSDEIEISNTIVRVWLRGGVDGEAGTVSVVARTFGGRIKEARFELRIRDT